MREDALTPAPGGSWCEWKGEAHYYSLFVDGDMNKDAVWYYPEPFEAAKIDGASEFRIYLNIVIPLSTPALATMR